MLKSPSELIKTWSQEDDNWIIFQYVVKVFLVGVTWQFIVKTLKFCTLLIHQFYLQTANMAKMFYLLFYQWEDKRQNKQQDIKTFADLSFWTLGKYNKIMIPNSSI